MLSLAFTAALCIAALIESVMHLIVREKSAGDGKSRQPNVTRRRPRCRKEEEVDEWHTGDGGQQ